MSIEEYENLGGYQYEDLEARLNKKIMKAGDVFFIRFNDDDYGLNSLNAMELHLGKFNQVELSIKKINLKKEWKRMFHHGYVPVSFKYLGENRAIELLTGEVFFISFFREQSKIIHKQDDDDFDYLFFNQDYYEEYIKCPLIISGDYISFEMPTDNMKAYYYKLVKQKNLKKLMQELIWKKRLEFVKNYQKIVQTRIYDIACVDNMVYDLDKKLEENKTLKKVKKK